MKFQLGQTVVAKNRIETLTLGGDVMSLDADEGLRGVVIAALPSGLYTVDFRASGGLVTDAFEEELEYTQ